MAVRPAARTFKKRDVLKATDMPMQKFQHWLDRRVVTFTSEDVPGDGAGRPRQFGLRTVTKLAIAHRISMLGVPANIAVTLASAFTDTPQSGRSVGGLFPMGTTYILASPDGDASVVNVKPEEDVSALLRDASIVVNVNEIISNIKFEAGTPK